MDRLLNRPTSVTNDQVWKRRVRWLALVVQIGCIGVFLADAMIETFFVPYGAFYIPLVCMAVFYRDPRWAWWLATLASALALWGFFTPHMQGHAGGALATRGASIAAIWVTAVLVRYARAMQDALAEQSIWLKEAERVRTAVFIALSEEMRAPLHQLTGVTAAMIATCRPDQTEPLRLVQSANKQLLASIENLLDLTHFDQRPIAASDVDVASVICQATECGRQVAADRQVDVQVDLPPSNLMARADARALRRILDNLIDNAVKFSPVGSIVKLAAQQRPGSITVQVRDSGAGMSPEVLERLRVPYDQVTPGMPISGAGLALSRRLAAAMGAELLFDSVVGGGTTVTLCLPA